MKIIEAPEVTEPKVKKIINVPELIEKLKRELDKMGVKYDED